MLYLALKAAISGIIVALVAEIAKRSPGVGGLVASLPLVSTLAMIWLWRDTGDAARVGAYAQSAFWFVLPSLPMFLVIPWLLKRGLSFWPALLSGCVLTMVLYLVMSWVAPKLGVRL